MRFSWPFSASAALYTLYFTLDTAILAAVAPVSEVGQYRAAYIFVSAALLVAVVVNNDVLRTRLALANRDSSFDIGSLVVRFGAISLLFGLVVAALLYFWGPWLVHRTFGSDFAPAGALVQVLGLALVPYYFNSWAANTLVGLGRIRRVLWAQVSLLVFNFVTCIVVLPRRGSEGAAFVTVVTECLGLMLFLSLVGLEFKARRGRRGGGTGGVEVFAGFGVVGDDEGELVSAPRLVPLDEFGLEG